MSRSGPPLNALQAFVAVAHARSVREAARRLGVGHSVVARHLTTLQDWARCRLVETSSAGATLTEEGQIMYAAVGPAFKAIAHVGEEFRPSAEREPIEIWCAPGLAARWLMPRLSALSAILLDKQILVRPTEQMPDFSAGAVDAAIVYGALPLDGDAIVSAELCRPSFFPVVSAAWIALNGLPTHAADLAHGPLIHENSDEQWRRWLEQIGAGQVGPLPGPRLWYANMAIDAAEHGQGIALTNRTIAHDAIRSGRLVTVTGVSAQLDSYHLLVPRRRASSPSIQKLRQWLINNLSDGDVLGPSGI